MNVQKHFKKAYLLSSDVKSDTYTYIPKKQALTKKFIQFNSLGVTMLSIDIDNCDIYTLSERLKYVPTPTIIVETDKGYHIHYELAYPISYTKHTLIVWCNHIRDELSKKLGGDKNAVGLKRVYRNPLVHTTAYNNVSYSLADFGIPYPKNSSTKKKKCRFNIDFSTIEKGNRNISMFNYLRDYAYANSEKDNLEEILVFLADEANTQLSEPLPQSQLRSIVKSIMRFMGRYTGTKDQTAFNIQLAKNKHKATILKIIAVLKQLQLKKVQLLSNRAIARTCKVSPTTVGTNKQEILDILINFCLINIRLSLEEYKKLNGDFMVYEFKCTNTKCKMYDKVVEYNIKVKEYEYKIKELRCSCCNSTLQRHFSSPSINTFGDGFKL